MQSMPLLAARSKALLNHISIAPINLSLKLLAAAEP